MIKKINSNNKINRNFKLTALLTALTITSSFPSIAEIISKEQVISDITYLASDD